MTSWGGIILILIFFTSTASCGLNEASITQSKGEQLAKVAPELISLYDEYSAYLASQRVGPFRPTNPVVPVIDDRVVIDAVASGDANALKSDLVTLGMREAVVFGRVVSGQLPIPSIPALAKLSTLNFARAAGAVMQRG